MRQDIFETEMTREEWEYWSAQAQQGIEALRQLRGTCKGTCVVAGNGLSQQSIPVTWLNDHQTFGLNYCHKREGFNPSFFVVGDVSVAVHEWKEAYERHSQIPMFLPSPSMDAFAVDRPGVYRYLRVLRHGQPVGKQIDPTRGIAFTSVTHAATLIAAFLGFTQILYVGLDGGDQTDHFYGKGYPEDFNHLGNEVIVQAWEDGFVRLAAMLPRVKLLNLSTSNGMGALPRADWINY